jgi:hypothetical protein
MPRKIVSKKEQDALEHEFRLEKARGRKPKTCMILCAYCNTNYRLGSRHYKSDFCKVAETQQTLYSKGLSTISRSYIELMKATDIPYIVAPMSQFLYERCTGKYRQTSGCDGLWAQRKYSKLLRFTTGIVKSKRVIFMRKCLDSESLLNTTLSLKFAHFAGYIIRDKTLAGISLTHLEQMSCDMIEDRIKSFHTIYLLHQVKV